MHRFYEEGWIEDTFRNRNENNCLHSILCIENHNGVSNNIVNILREQGHKVIKLSYYEGNNTVYSTDDYTISDNEDLKESIKKFMGNGIVFDKILILAINKGSEILLIEEINCCFERGAFCLINVVKTLYSNDIQTKPEIVIVTDHAFKISGCDMTIDPCNHSLVIMTKVVKLEHADLKLKCIDVDNVSTTCNLIDEIINEYNKLIIAIRNKKIYIPLFRNTPSKQFKNKITVTTKGVYLVLGGAGGIGLEICKYFASKTNVCLIIIGRDNLPIKEEWIKHSSNRTINEFLSIEDSGSEVYYYSANIGDTNRMKQVIDNVYNRFHNINGIIHSAGTYKDRNIMDISFDSIKDELLAKVYGSLNINNLIKLSKLDFIMGFSSLATILPGTGQCIYVLTNAFLDAWCYKWTINDISSKIIKWPAWKEVGMASVCDVQDSERLFFPLDNNLAIEYFNRIFHSELEYVLPGELNKEKISELSEYYQIEIST